MPLTGQGGHRLRSVSVAQIEIYGAQLCNSSLLAFLAGGHIGQRLHSVRCFVTVLLLYLCADRETVRWLSGQISGC